MNQFKIVLAYEFNTLIRKKSFIASTIVIILLGMLAFSIPTIINLFSSDDSEKTKTQTVAVSFYDNAQSGSYIDGLNSLNDEYNFEASTMDKAALTAAVENGDYSFAVIVNSPLSYTRISGTTSLYDNFDSFFSNILLSSYQSSALINAGLSEQESAAILHAEVENSIEYVSGGKNAMQNYLITYILILAMYMLILLYGNMVSNSVATEKSTRAMELLITSAKPQSLMFGKVFGVSLACFTQFALIMLSAFLGYKVNAGNIENFEALAFMLKVEPKILMLLPVFLIFGFLLYAFLFAALASLVSRMEELNSTVQPAMFMLVIAMFVVIFSIAGGSLDNPLLIACSFIPFTSPMAMFARVAMADVASWQVIISIAILIGSTIGMGFLAAGIYRLGVLLYGNPPKFKELSKLLKANKA